jgi:hypothetical protein
MVTPTGLESAGRRVVSRLEEVPDGAAESSTQRPDASRSVATEPDATEDGEPSLGLPTPAADLFIRAGAIVAERAARGRASRAQVEGILGRAAAQAGRLLAAGEVV